MANKNQTLTGKFASVVGDFTVDYTYYDGVNKFSTVVTDIDFSIESTREYDTSSWHISGGEHHTTIGCMNKTIKIYVSDSFHPGYTIIMKITGGPDKSVQIKTLLKDNIPVFVKMIKHHGMEKDWPIQHQTAYWHLIDYASAVSVNIHNTLNVRITDGKVSFTSGTKKGIVVIYCNPLTDVCIVFYKVDGCSRLTYFDLKDEDIQTYYDALITKIPGAEKFGLSVAKPSAASFDPYKVNTSASVTQPIAALAPLAPVATTPEPTHGLQFAFDGDFINITATVPISNLEFSFDVGVQQLMILNSNTLLPPDSVKCNVINTSLSVVTLNIGEKQARLMFMNCGRSITRSLHNIKFHLA